jgi:hypothetical protein
LTACDDLKEKTDNSKLCLVFFGDSSTKDFIHTFLQTADNTQVSEKFQFFHINDDACAKKFGAQSTPAVALFRKFDVSPIFFEGTLVTENLVQWMKTSMVPTLIEFTEEYIEPIFGQKKAALFLFRAPGDASSDFS